MTKNISTGRIDSVTELPITENQPYGMVILEANSCFETKVYNLVYHQTTTGLSYLVLKYYDATNRKLLSCSRVNGIVLG